MLFNSFEFVFLFLPVTLLIYFFIASYRSPRQAMGFLVIASLVFYSYWDVRYLPLLLLSILFNWAIGSKIAESRSKLCLTVGIAGNLAALCFFKYTGFIMRSVNDFIGSAGFVPDITLPLGISFFTFTQTAYLVDAYRGETKEYGFLPYSLFVTIFPHLIAGPILYHKNIIPQFSESRNFRVDPRNMALGIAIFSIGLFKKVMIADTFSPWVQAMFGNADKVTFFEAWTGSLAYTLQIYFDFSGYSEMAIGLGYMFNFKLPVNFDSPYKSTSIIEFWRRWHITLSTFLKNYLYIPLGGNRRGTLLRYRNLLLTMLLGGLWHGAGWTFVIWGGLHGLYLGVNHWWRSLNYKMPRGLAWVLTFVSVVVAWVFFRAGSLTDALLILKAMSGANGIAFSYKSEAAFAFLQNYGVTFKELKYPDHTADKFLGVLLGIIILLSTKGVPEYMETFRPNLKWAIITAALLLMSIGYFTNVSEFLYFQF